MHSKLLKTQPLFIFSLPRSGSTLLQRILATSSDISTVSEPWILLPLFSYLNRLQTWSIYSSKTYRSAISELLDSLPSAESDLIEAANAYGSSIYEKLGKGKPYFLDKTPRYHIISDEIIETFPNGKFIFLWRNPLSVLASISRTWKKGRWFFGSHDIDLYEGLEKLIHTFSQHQKKCLAVRYEDIIASPENSMRRIERYLDLEAGSFDLNSLGKKNTHGTMGDLTGIKEYSDQISSKSIDRWQSSYCNKLRKRTASAYLSWLGKDRLNVMGYSLEKLLETLHTQTNTNLGISDYYYRFRDCLCTSTQSKLIKTMYRNKPVRRLE